MVIFKCCPFSGSGEAVTSTPDVMEVGQTEKRLGSAEWTSHK